MIKALYAGSFDPLTRGHENIVTRASKFCDELVIGVIENPQKTPLFSSKERVEQIREAVKDMPNVKVDSFSGLLADYVNKNGFNMVIRGLRSMLDFDNEIQMAQMNAKIYKENVETVFLMTDPAYSFLSSSMVKEVCFLGGDIKGLVPENILLVMEGKLK
ncbi:MAG: pantetheine-phosphate adenylyltransferase [Eubacteriales bacterium]|nr:pantetheine-phosphate adenylyltransferase [Eubacteriales bacterium]MDY3332249.1 pantetheine-phosphate adenylyltransferase [Gallibacter sp.]